MQQPPDIPQTILFTFDEHRIVPYFVFAHIGDRLEWKWQAKHNLIFSFDDQGATDIIKFRSGDPVENGTFYFYIQEKGAVVRNVTSPVRQLLVYSSEVS